MISDDQIMMLFGIWIHWILPIGVIIVAFCFVMAAVTGQLRLTGRQDGQNPRKDVSSDRSARGSSQDR